MASNEVDVELHVPGVAPIGNPNFIVREYHRSTLFHMRGAEWSRELLSGLRESCRSAAIIHSHSLWMIPNIYPYWAKKGTECKLITQPRGTLSEWALSLSKWKKRLSGWCGQYAAMRATDMWVATAEDEYNDIRRLGYTQPVAILPNGVDLPYVGDNDSKHSSGGRRRMFFLSRIHPKKNVEMLIRCWARLESQFPEWDLSIVGPDKNNPYADHMLIEDVVASWKNMTEVPKNPRAYLLTMLYNVSTTHVAQITAEVNHDMRYGFGENETENQELMEG